MCDCHSLEPTDSSRDPETCRGAQRRRSLPPVGESEGLYRVGRRRPDELRRSGRGAATNGHVESRPEYVAGVGKRRRPDSNRGSRICSPLPYHLATAPTHNGKGEEPPGVPMSLPRLARAGNRTRTGDPHLGKVVLYQLSYSRRNECLRRVLKPCTLGSEA